MQRRGQLLVAESYLPKVAAQLPVGMGTTEQLEGFREVRTRLLAMATALGLKYSFVNQPVEVAALGAEVEDPNRTGERGPDSE